MLGVELCRSFCGWTKSISHRLKIMVEPLNPLFVGIDRGIESFPWDSEVVREADFAKHPQFVINLVHLAAWPGHAFGCASFPLLGPPVVPFYREGSPANRVQKEKGYPYSNLSTGGPRLHFPLHANISPFAGCLAMRAFHSLRSLVCRVRFPALGHVCWFCELSAGFPPSCQG